MSRLCLVALPLLIVGGCASTKTTTIESDPPGARIMVNGDYIGDAPTTVNLRDNSFVTGVSTVYDIEAVPKPEMTEASGEVQRRTIYSRDGLPSRVFFDMRLARQRPKERIEADINVRQGDR